MKYWLFVQKVGDDIFVDGEALPLSAYLPTVEGYLIENYTYKDDTHDCPIETLYGVFSWINRDELRNGFYVACDTTTLETATRIRILERFGRTAIITKRGCNHIMPFWWARNICCMHTPNSKFYQALVSVQINDEWQKNVYIHPSVSFPLLAELPDEKLLRDK